ncbi:uncharacterized protein LOC129723283 [Wyeomyia smithii]|uniref:uncharacterized protein LOC129723283 n=1 Tax=Wyeomyia smithii TaxID=174621 RepID=UPI002467C52A|nr:uncharacterized protein LOC129723283 [Wyeomyia smithii]
MKTNPNQQRGSGPKHNKQGSNYKKGSNKNKFFHKGTQQSKGFARGNNQSQSPRIKFQGKQKYNNDRPPFGQHRNDRSQNAGKLNKPKPQGAQTNSHQQKPQQQNQQRAAPNLDQLFTVKPAKLDYCLAPERLEAQSRALKRFEQQERDKDRQKQRSEKERRHKLMTAKTRKGQPVMQGRMELLYEKVQKMVDQG